MALHPVEGIAGPPWERPLAGRVDKLVVESELLADNPLGDPARRPLYVYVPPRADAGELPTVYLLQGYGGQLDNWWSRPDFELNTFERLDAMFAAGDCLPALIVFVDAWTVYGGSQFLNSPSTGPYMDYVCDEVVPFIDERYPSSASRDRRAVCGKSSGGYGAMVLSMMRPDVFGAFASHAGDALFECSYQRDFPAVARTLRDQFDGSMEVFLEHFKRLERFDWGRDAGPLVTFGMACAYSPDPERPGRGLLPFEISTGRLIDNLWEQWLALDPVRMAPRHGEALKSMRRIYLDAGNRDEFYLDLGARAFGDELDKLGVHYTFELFDGTHMGTAYRYPRAVRELVLALDAG
jgi:pimeloyl-ACP methyl ester carboxylesterase